MEVDKKNTVPRTSLYFHELSKIQHILEIFCLESEFLLKPILADYGPFLIIYYKWKYFLISRNRTL